MVGRNIVVAIPSQLVEAYDLHNGDALEIIPLGPESFMIQKPKQSSVEDSFE